MITRRSVGAHEGAEDVFIDIFPKDKTITLNVNGFNMTRPISQSMDDLVTTLKEAIAAL